MHKMTYTETEAGPTWIYLEPVPPVVGPTPISLIERTCDTLTSCTIRTRLQFWKRSSTCSVSVSRRKAMMPRSASPRRRQNASPSGAGTTFNSCGQPACHAACGSPVSTMRYMLSVSPEAYNSRVAKLRPSS